MKEVENELIVSLDIGTSKIVAIVAELSSDGMMNILGVGTSDSRGIKKGVVVDIELTVHSIREAIEQAELMSDTEIDVVFASMGGSHIEGLNSTGVVAIKDKEVSQQDIIRVIDSAQAVPLSSDQVILHTIPQSFSIDSQDGIKEPIGMYGVRLESQVHLVITSLSAKNNILKCLEKCDLQSEALVLEQLGSSQAILSEDEKDLGVCLIDIGGGTTDLAVFFDGAIQYTSVIPIAGDQITNDIAHALRTPFRSAEQIKIKYACALTSKTQAKEIIKVPSIGDKSPRDLSRQTLAEVIEPRYEELFSLVKSELEANGYIDRIASGIVLTGGSSKMDGALELAEEFFNMPVSLGMPVNHVRGLMDVIRDPAYSTAVGLLFYGKSFIQTQPKKSSFRQGSWFSKMKNVLMEQF